MKLMKLSHRLLLLCVFGLLCKTLTQQLVAGVNVTIDTPEVYHAGTNERAGTLTFTVDGDDFSGATPETPVYIRIASHAGVLSDTLVDQALSFGREKGPLYLAMMVKDGQDGVVMQAAPDAVAIVRWVQGETGFWLRVTESTARWLNDGTQSLAPSPDNPVQFWLGLSARASSSRLGTNVDLRNGSHNSYWADPRYIEPYYATSTLLSLDFSNAGIDALPMPVGYEIQAYNHDVDSGDGFYNRIAGQVLDVAFSGSDSLAFAKDRDIQVSHSVPVIDSDMVAPSGLQAWHSEFTLNLENTESDSAMRAMLHNGSTIAINCPGGVGFKKGSLTFSDGQPVACGINDITYGNPFEMEGQTLYQYVSIKWARGSRELNPFLLQFDATFYQVAGDAENFRLAYRLDLMHQPPTEDVVPYQREWQHAAPYREAVYLVSDSWPVGQGTQVRVIPHLTRLDGTFETTVRLVNQGTDVADYRMNFYGEDGILLGSQVNRLLTSENLDIPAVDLLNGQEVSHIEVIGGRDVLAAAIYKAKGEGRGPAQVWADDTLGRQWLLNLGNNALTYDGLAVVNMGEDTAQMTVAFLDAVGNILEEKNLEPLNPLAKKLHNLSTLSAFPLAAAVTIRSDQPLAVTALRGDMASTFLWQNKALPVNQ